jgi:hypothetical protein
LLQCGAARLGGKRRLIVTTPNGQESHGNMPLGAAGFDRSNNVEQVLLTNDVSGTATITVRAFRVLSPQSYALVIRVF